MLKFLVLLASLCATTLAFTNPIKATDGSDPHLTYFDGNYYLLTTTWNDVQMTKASTLEGLKTGTVRKLWKDANYANIWAPELQYVDGAWRIYYTAGTSGTFDDQHLHVLTGGSTPDTAFSYTGRLVITGRDVWAIDATVMFHSSGNYLVYSSWDGDEQCLWIAKLTSATTVGASTKISAPTLSWERENANVNEGPAALYYAGRTWLSFSASNCAGGGYKLGLLELTGSNPLLRSSWTKTSTPIFTSANGEYAPGHNGWFQSPDGTEFWIVYHASPTADATCDGQRRTMVQKIGWTPANTPNLGDPVALTTSLLPPSGE